MADLEKATWENNNQKISKEVLIGERSLKHIYDDEVQMIH
jgi:hypothetical protein